MADNLFQLRISLLDVEPEIWRTIVTSPDVTLRQLHSFVQAAFGWEDYHLHEFTTRDQRRFGMPDPDDPGVIDDAKTRLTEVVQTSGDAILYNYDFGDDWFCGITVEAVQPEAQLTKWPMCITGARHAPPEDTGGPMGYSDLLNQLGGRSARARKEAKEVLGEDFDPEQFEMEQINLRLQRGAPSPRSRASRHH